MKIAIASDHAGFKAKEFIKENLEVHYYQIEDFGCFDDQGSCDFPVFGIPATLSVSQKKNDRAILICGSGLGMVMLANKIPGIFAALVYNKKVASLSRYHNNANVICLGGREFDQLSLWDFVRIWLTTGYAGGKYEKRMAMVKNLDELKGQL